MHATADGVAVVHHDRTLDRTTDAVGPIAARTAAELDRVRVRGAHRAEPMPRLADVLAALPDTRFTVELKSGAAVRPVLAVLAELDAWDRVCVAGYHDAWLRAARRLARPTRAAVHLDGPPVGRWACGWAAGALPGRRAPAAGRTAARPWCAATSPSCRTASPGSPSSTPTCCASPTRAAARCTCGPSTTRP